ncbi:hypothetical protein EELLY_v1c03660 [Entomoplasma ellychniae]|uniref:TRASH transcription regulator C-terminal prokaryotic domain-containing protein n=1 Tax=Entomoplasma ellychniae TaxID=2114 RepID=A0A8E2QVY6_9MOLU|nr:TRASH domain-containing protein [Entomoplasma ellychniae]PPE04353.1 hypothetical protein EELLY_v1c00270 [Entomoplasma ellychniae]PPE04615.1 hypothetical protein EELLY_v1c02950 [Entomoplasma ellychniae]PPE04686.1 hypothetical protein EELLY_v1c03660 [Entomoplasma ellychniae]
MSDTEKIIICDQCGKEKRVNKPSVWTINNNVYYFCTKTCNTNWIVEIFENDD